MPSCCAGVVDHADFADADALVDPHAIVAAGTSVESDNGLLLSNRVGPALAPDALDRLALSDPSLRLPALPRNRLRGFAQADELAADSTLTSPP